MELRHIMALQNVTHLFGIIIFFLLKHIIKLIFFNNILHIQEVL